MNCKMITKYLHNFNLDYHSVAIEIAHTRFQCPRKTFSKIHFFTVLHIKTIIREGGTHGEIILR